MYFLTITTIEKFNKRKRPAQTRKASVPKREKVVFFFIRFGTFAPKALKLDDDNIIKSYQQRLIY